MRAPERLGPYLYRQSDACFPLGADTLALGAFATLRRGDRVCDLGCGAGALLLLLAGREGELTLTGIEQSPDDAALARKNLADNGLAGTIYTGDVGEASRALPAGGFSLAVSNPPYFSPRCGRLVKNGGRFALVHRPERLADLFAALRGAGLEPKRLRLVQHGPDKPPSAALVEAVRQGRPGLEVLPALLQTPPTPAR